MNKVILIGRLAREPEVKYTQGNEPLAVTRFAMAVDRPLARRSNSNGEKTVDFLNCVCFGKRGEAISKYFHKGNRIAVVGRIQTGEYTDQSGNKRYTTDIVVEEFDFIESRSEREASANSSAPAYSNAPQASNSQPEGFYSIDDSTDDEDLPF